MTYRCIRVREAEGEDKEGRKGRRRGDARLRSVLLLGPFCLGGDRVGGRVMDEGG